MSSFELAAVPSFNAIVDAFFSTHKLVLSSYQFKVNVCANSYYLDIQAINGRAHQMNVWNNTERHFLVCDFPHLTEFATTIFINS